MLQFTFLTTSTATAQASEKVWHPSLFFLQTKLEQSNIPQLIYSPGEQNNTARPADADYAILFTYEGAENTKKVSVAGNVTNWQTRTMQKNQQNVYFLRLPLSELPSSEGQRKDDFLALSYKYLVDGIWIADPKNPQKHNDSNGIRISAMELDMQSSPPVYASAHVINMSGRGDVGEVMFQIYLPRATTVHVVGDFNGWDSQAHPRYQLRSKASSGYFYTRVRLPKGQHAYLYLVDGKNLRRDEFNPNTQYNRLLGKSCSVIHIR